MNAQQQDLENFYSDFTNRWDSSDKSKAKKRNNKKKVTISTAPTQETKEGNNGNFVQITKATKSPVKGKIREGDEGETTKVEKNRDENLYLKSKREAKSLAVAQKLKEMEMMDMSNVDHVLDIEEVLHYYSRLTCPAYLDIVDKFFMDLYTEFLGPPASPKSVNSRPKFRSVRA
ncbi:hypothetical protein COLO4_34929 [Corchorus olitorius]|uniref:Uncharacterized protein n=1 Tax=Corchorus olitorius TaxID=93759 RepID=A0A1R3GIU0_9ROSI|nr:hypothetical protein COLO4_34929 [Corchorus olitorius]